MSQWLAQNATETKSKLAKIKKILTQCQRSCDKLILSLSLEYTYQAVHGHRGPSRSRSTRQVNEITYAKCVH